MSWNCAIYTTTHDGRDLKNVDARLDLLDEFYHLHHRALEAWTENALNDHGRCLIIDCHSYPSKPLPCNQDQTLPRPEICIGTCPPDTSANLVSAAVITFDQWGYEVLVDKPYAGSIVPIKYLESEPKVSSIMIEVNRRLYMNEITGERNANFEKIRAQLGESLRAIVTDWEREVSVSEEQSV